MKIIQANQSHIPLLAPLFDKYRVFYKQTSNVKAATSFLEQRLSKSESIVFLAFIEDEPVGFTQLYTTFSSVSMQPYYILNDLYVNNAHRREGIGAALLTTAQEFCIKNGYKGLALETATDNPAQKLYEKMGWKKDSHGFHYFWPSNS
ncbi:GNAT family N-acetyltransferase [Zobellia amurskyensis]|uniref:GNAT family N-acetyltransferase n=1 Tax=Zobellia amurskyensis TaxID=248905 RepID=A0A7X2ZU43_9FLAO|nr:GNAT family N-acetyltransferase [Zobellia amurskyensis]MUH36431.1 GNAT family N-acetyltransferase [Zobellia amurskyensis]